MRTGFALLASLALGCSGSTDGAGSVSDVGGAADAAGEVATCGTNVGDTLCDLDLQGYVRDATDGLATSATAGSFKLSGALATAKQRYAFIFNTAFW